MGIKTRVEQRTCISAVNKSPTCVINDSLWINQNLSYCVIYTATHPKCKITLVNLPYEINKKL